MQAITRFTAIGSSGVIQRVVDFQGTITTNVTDDVDAVNIKIADFLHSVGVNAVYEARRDIEDPFLWINDVPFLVYGASNRWFVSFGHISLGALSSFGNGYLVFNGNPKGLFVVRFFSENQSLYDGFFIGKVLNSIDLKTHQFAGIALRTNAQTYTATIDGNEDYSEYRMSAIYAGFTFTNVDTSLTISDFYTSINGEYIGKVPINATQYLGWDVYVEAAYKLPLIDSLDYTVKVNNIFQPEIEINGKKYWVASYKGAGSGYFRFGLVALEDEDPLISEDALMAEVTS